MQTEQSVFSICKCNYLKELLVIRKMFQTELVIQYKVEFSTITFFVQSILHDVALKGAIRDTCTRHKVPETFLGPLIVIIYLFFINNQ